MNSTSANTSAPADPSTLIAEARACLDKAYAPYSQFPVAAAVVDDRGRIFVGVNVENASYGLTMCAERVAIFAAIASGAHRILAVAVAAKNATLVPPCGACRQVMAEFCDPETPVYGDAGTMSPNHWTVASLLPQAFVPSYLAVERKAP